MSKRAIHRAAQALGQHGGLARHGLDYDTTSSATENAQALGRLGGLVTSEAKARTARENGKRGGRPRIQKAPKK